MKFRLTALIASLTFVSLIGCAQQEGEVCERFPNRESDCAAGLICCGYVRTFRDGCRPVTVRRGICSATCTDDPGTDPPMTCDGGSGEDTGVSDSSAGDSMVSDTESADTSVSDTGSADTGSADTGSADTGSADTGSADTGSADASDGDVPDGG